jgi:DNA-binding CsgD family transcriptional regulator
MRPAELLSLTAQFANAAFEPDGWLKALDALAESTGSTRGQLIGIGGPAVVPFNLVTNLAPQALEDFLAINGGDPGVNWRVAAAAGTQSLQVSSEVDYERARPALQTDVYDDFCNQYDMPFGCQTELYSNDGLLIGLAVLRTRSDGPSTAEARMLMEDIAPHVRQAVRTAMILDQRGPELVAGALDAMSMAAFVCDGRGRVRQMTSAAEDIVGTGRPLRLEAGRLRDSSSNDEASVERAVATAMADGLASTIVVGAPDNPTLLSIIPAPARDWSFTFAPGAILILRSGVERGAAKSHLLRALYGLTASEAEVVVCFLAGLSRDGIAAERGVSIGTVQSQMKSIFSKVGVKREADLAIKLAPLIGV